MDHWRSQDLSYKCLVKLIVIGDSRAGKSSIVQQFVDSYFDPSFMSTIAIDFRVKTITIDDTIVKVYVWDTAGQERFRTLTKAYYRDAMGVLLVYDITDRSSFSHLQGWLKQVEENSDGEVAITLIGNKTDQEKSREVSYEEGAAFAKEVPCSFFETSAKIGTNIQEAFANLAKQCKDRLLKEEDVSERQKKTIPLLDIRPKKCSACVGV